MVAKEIRKILLVTQCPLDLFFSTLFARITGRKAHLPSRKLQHQPLNIPFRFHTQLLLAAESDVLKRETGEEMEGVRGSEARIERFLLKVLKGEGAIKKYWPFGRDFTKNCSVLTIFW